MSFVSAYILYDGNSGTYVGGEGKTIQINCDRMRAYSPRPCYLLRRLMPGDGTQIENLLTFQVGSPEWADPNTLRGYAIEVDGQDTMIDITTWQALIDACNCPDCDTPNGNPVASVYGGAPPAFAALTLNTYCITRTGELGTGYDHDKAVMDYTTQYVGNMRLTSNNGTRSLYQIQAFQAPSPVGNDTIALGVC